MKSLDGSFAGGHLSVVRDLVTGLPIRLAAPVALAQAQSSPRSTAAHPRRRSGRSAAEWRFRGSGRLRRHGTGIAQPGTVYPRLQPNGGEIYQQGRSVSVDWRSSAAGGTVDVEVSRDGFTWISLENDGQNDGHLDWLIDAATFAPGNYQVRVTTSDGLLSDTSDSAFTVTLPIRIYYVDDSSNTNDEYTPDAVGNDANDGLSALTPKASIQAILAQYDLGAGDIILVDTGSYASTTTIVITPMTAARPTPAA